MCLPYSYPDRITTPKCHCQPLQAVYGLPLLAGRFNIRLSGGGLEQAPLVFSENGYPMRYNLLPVKTKLNASTAEMLALGGAVLGGGGGGRLEAGLRLGQLALELGDAFLVDLPDGEPEAGLVGLAAWGASPADFDPPRPRAYSRAVELLAANTGATVTGLVNCGNGAVDTLAGWVQSALLGVPLVDVGFEARLHPVPVLDVLYRWPDDCPPPAMAVVGYSAQTGNRLEIFSRAAPPALAALLQQSAGILDGRFAVAVGMLPVSWVRRQAKAGLISRAVELGRLLKQTPGRGNAVAAALGRSLPGQCISGTVTHIRQKMVNRRLYRIICLKDTANQPLNLVWQYRYLLLDSGGKRLAAFPDVIMALGSRATPLNGREPGTGQDIHLVVADGPALTSADRLHWESICREIESLTRESNACLAGCVDSDNGTKGG